MNSIKKSSLIKILNNFKGFFSSKGYQTNHINKENFDHFIKHIYIEHRILFVTGNLLRNRLHICIYADGWGKVEPSHN
jgi:hypothetical protein